MSAITRIRAWSNPGFTEDGPEAPHYGFTLPLPSEDLRNLDYEPSASRIFSEFKIADAVWESWKGMSFLEVTYSWNNSLSDTVLYGFIDEVELLSDTTGAAAVRVRWHVDEWMTYLSQATLGFGHVLRRPVGAADPIQSYERKRWFKSAELDMITPYQVTGAEDSWWVLLAHGVTINGKTSIEFITWPVRLSGGYLYGYNTASPPEAKRFPTLYESVVGKWDELLGLDPNSIYGAWVLPTPPMDRSALSGAGASSVPIEVDQASALWEPFSYVSNPNPLVETAGFRSVTTQYGGYDEIFGVESKTISGGLTPSELNPIHIVGFTGESIGTLPIGATYTSYTYRVIGSSTECYIEIRFDGTDSRILGTCFSIPALPLDLTENAWSSYQYSGQREYDVEARNNQSLKSGIESATSGAMTGALMGGFGPLGAAAGAIGGAISGGVSLATDFLWFNEAEQGLKDKLASRQAPGILLSGGAWDAVTNGTTIRAITLQMDSYSAGRAADERSLVGVKVDEYNSSNDTVRASTGFYQIVNLAVTGSIPNSAKRSIANRFAKGVKLI